jgi:ferredoxin-NADP reductase
MVVARTSGQSLSRFEAGALSDKHLPNGRVRQHSLCNDPAATGRWLFVALIKDAPRTLLLDP